MTNKVCPYVVCLPRLKICVRKDTLAFFIHDCIANKFSLLNTAMRITNLTKLWPPVLPLIMRLFRYRFGHLLFIDHLLSNYFSVRVQVPFSMNDWISSSPALRSFCQYCCWYPVNLLLHYQEKFLRSLLMQFWNSYPNIVIFYTLLNCVICFTF